MLTDARRVPEGETLRGDVCVIGAGAAGITLARALGEAHLSVVVLESGGLEYEQGTQALYRGRSSGLPYFPLDSARQRFFGGSTNHWGGVCRPFDELDFERRDWIPYSGWPIRRQDLDPYYAPATEIVGLGSDDFSVASWDERDGFSPLPLGPRTTPRVAQVVDYDDRSFGARYRGELEAAADVEVYLHANVAEIEVDDAGRMASRVHAATLSGSRFSVEARHFVLATGGVENPRLLLASNRQQPRGLGNQHDLVGRFFTEHPRFVAATVLPADEQVDVGFYDVHAVDGSEIQGYIAFPADVQRREELVDVQVFVRPTYDPRFEEAFGSDDVDALRELRNDSIGDLGRHLMNVVRDLTTFREFTVPGAPVPVPYPEIVEKLVGSRDEIRDRIPDLLGDIAAEGYKRLEGAPVEQIDLTTRLDQAPNPDSRVTLSRAKDKLGMPRVELDWQLSPIDRHSATRASEILGSSFAAAGLGRVQVVFDEDESGWPDDLAGGYHHLGTTRMSDDPRQGVVDGDCRVHDISNLFIAGSSVFTTGGSSTPTLTIVALALRLADHLRAALR